MLVLVVFFLLHQYFGNIQIFSFIEVRLCWSPK